MCMPRICDDTPFTPLFVSNSCPIRVLHVAPAASVRQCSVFICGVSHVPLQGRSINIDVSPKAEQNLSKTHKKTQKTSKASANMKLKEIHRTSTFAWSPAAALPLIATGTVAGALDASFSDESSLEIWAPSFLDRNEYDLGGPGQTGPRGVVTDSTRCVPVLHSPQCSANCFFAASTDLSGDMWMILDRRVSLQQEWRMASWLYGIQPRFSLARRMSTKF